MECYLDNSATTKPCEAAVTAAVKIATDVFGNPSSLHRHGFRALQLLESARAAVAKPLSAESGEIYFTPSGTAANNTAIFGAVQKNRRRGNKIVTTAYEHPSVEKCMERLESEGFTVERLQPDQHGNITAAQFADAIDENTILVSLMAVNNEVGSILPFESVGALIRRKKSPALLHVDAVQGFLKLPIVPKKCGIDLMSVSAHKVHGLKGVGALYMKKGVQIPPYILGGGQENGLCSGTQGMPAIAAFKAAVDACGDVQKNLRHVAFLNARLREKLTAIEGVTVHSPDNALPYILNISLEGIPSQVSVNYLSEAGVYVSAGSACSKGHRSPVLTAMGLSTSQIDSAIRLSLSRETSEEEIDYCVCALKNAAAQLRKKG